MSADGKDEDTPAPPVPGWPGESGQRLEKARALGELGVTVYPTRFERTHRLGEIVSAYDGKPIEELEELGVDVRIAGRVVHAGFWRGNLGDDRTLAAVRPEVDEPSASGQQPTVVTLDRSDGADRHRQLVGGDQDQATVGIDSITEDTAGLDVHPE